MHRRDFLKISGAALGSSLLIMGIHRTVLALPVEAHYQGKGYRGYRDDGDIYVSEDSGTTWKLHTRLGSEYSIEDIFVDSSDQIYARIGFMQYDFHLALSSGDQWVTV